MNTVAYEIIRYSPYVILLPLLAGIFVYKNSSLANRVLIVHITIASFTAFTSVVMWNYKVNNLPLLHLYTVEEFTLLSIYYALIFPWKSIKPLLWIVTGIFAVFCIYNALRLQSIYESNTYARSIEALVMVIYGGGGFYCLLKQPTDQAMHRSSFFWVNTGYFIYFATALFLFLVDNNLIRLGAGVVVVAWAAHALVMSCMYTMVSIGLWKSR